MRRNDTRSPPLAPLQHTYVLGGEERLPVMHVAADFHFKTKIAILSVINGVRQYDTQAPPLADVSLADANVQTYMCAWLEQPTSICLKKTNSS